MKELLLQYARYNIWANKRIIDVLLKHDEEVLNMEIKSSFPSLQATVFHSWGAESIWLKRLHLEEKPVFASMDFKGPFAEACNEWQKASEGLLQFIEKQYDDKALEHVFQYNDLKGTPHKNPVYATLQHVFNHSTYHRGQLVTMLREVGETKLPTTDFIVYIREQKK